MKTDFATSILERIRCLHGFLYYGNAVDRILGVVATQSGNWEMAEQAFEEGLALCRRAHNQPEEAAIYYEQARMALMRSGTETGHTTRSLQHIYDLCGQARKLFLQYDMQRAVDLVNTLQEGMQELEQRDTPIIPQQASAQHITLEQLAHPGYQLELTLTKRELEVLRLVAEGHTDREVADALVISPRTVNRHLSNIFVKLDVPGRAAAVAFAVRQGLV